jgi:hypothetical protein
MRASAFPDALDLFFVNSYANGATSWLPNVLPENIKIVITITKGTSTDL